MSDLRDAIIVRAVRIQSFEGWQAVGAAPLAAKVLKAREGQSQLFIALTGFLVLIAILGSWLAKRIESSLRQLAQSAADLAIAGTKPEKIDSLVIRELSDLSINIATVGSQVAHERGALVTYQRRLRSIALHAPVVVYALEINESQKGPLVYVSEAMEKLLGYSG